MKKKGNKNTISFFSFVGNAQGFVIDFPKIALEIFQTMEEQKEKRWYALYTKPRAEKKLRDRLNMLKIENYLPVLIQKKKWSDRFKEIATPIFPSYIFVKINYQQEAVSVLKEPNAVLFVQFQG
ncbi:MAG: transcription termination/antitermination NusG family protein, partial [Spirochaetota bacterium]